MTRAASAPGGAAHGSAWHAVESVRRWLIAGTVLLGVFMAVMDVSVVNVALPHMMGTFGQDLSAITWVATSYSIAEIIMATMAGWWSTLIGRKRLYLFSVVTFTAGSILCGTASSFPQMLFYRVIQGVGGGALIPLALAIIRETFPPRQQGTAMAIYGMGVVLAPAAGPVIGGWLVDTYSWPMIFYVNVPVGILAFFMIGAMIHDPPHLRRGVKSIDWGGIALLSIALTGLQVIMERGQELDWFSSPWILWGSVLTAAAFIGLILWEVRAKEPVMNVRLFRNLPLSAGSAIGVIFGIALFGTTFLIPAFVQNLLGYSAYDAGMVLMPRAVALFCVMPIAGWLYHRLDARLMILLGIAILCWSFYDMGNLAFNAGFWNFVPILVIMGAGMPFIFVTLTGVSLSTVPKPDLTEASSLFTLARKVGGNIGYAAVTTILERQQQIHTAHLVKNIAPTNPAYLHYHATVTHRLLDHGLAPLVAGQTATFLAARELSNQAQMLAFNDLAWIMGEMFLLIIPLLLLLPGKGEPDAVAE